MSKKNTTSNTLLSPINFEPVVGPRKDSKDPNSKTAITINSLFQTGGTTLSELSGRLSVTGKAVDVKSARNWVTKSFLAPRGIGVRSEVGTDAKGNPELRLYGYTHDAATA